MLAALLMLCACELRRDDGTISEPVASPCQPVVFEQARMTLCTARPGEHRIRTALGSAPGDTPYRSLVALRDALTAAQRGRIAMAMNGGMFEDGGQPIGYYVEEGRRLQMINRREEPSEKPGDFDLLPNGIFFGQADGNWQVLSTDAFAAAATKRPFFATRSGPMLVIDGRLHPKITSDGQSRLIRNAVGVDAHGRAQFVISQDPVSFGKLARFYRDVLGVRNALFLDGSVSQLWDPGTGRMDSGAALGPLIVVEIQAEAAS